MATRMVGEFDVKMSWQSYCDRLEMYFLVNSVKDELKLPTLIAFMGESAYELLVILCSPRKPANMTFSEAVKVMREHLQPSPSILAERYKFRQRRQHSGESIADYVAILKKHTRFCEFGGSLDDNLRDQFVCGISSDLIRQRLFAEGNIKFVKAVSVASALEAAERDAAVVVGRGNVSGPTEGGHESSRTSTVLRRSSAVSELTGDVNRMQIGGCAACGDYRHTKVECRFAKYQCSKCRKFGHIRRMCQDNDGGINNHRGRLQQSRDSGSGAGRGVVRGLAGTDLGGSGGGVRHAGGRGYARSGKSWPRTTTGAATMHAFETGDVIDTMEEEPIYQMSLSQYKPSQAFNKIKRLLISSKILSRYDDSRPVVVTCDASSRGIGAVLGQRAPDGHEYPIAYASRTLTSAEYHYSQIHKEALAIVFSVKKCHQYLYGRPFVLKTDHKPLVSIFGSELGIPSMTASRLQCWALILSAYNFHIEYVNTNANTADALSRLVEGYKAINETNNEVPDQTYLLFASDALLLKYEDIRDETKRDPILSRVLSYVRDGWPNEVVIRELSPYLNRRSEIYIELGCLMWGHRLIVPKSCQNMVLKELHDTHMGIIKTKGIARSYVWWPGIDEMLEDLCRNCTICAEMSDQPVHHSPQSWTWPTRPWTRLQVDILGPIHGHKYLVMEDATSKWIEASPVVSTMAKVIIGKIREIWSRFGIPKQLVSDNGPPFTSEEFGSFLETNGVEQIFSAPYHPASNGLAENAVKLCKRVIKKAIIQNMEVELALQRFLLVYRTTEHSTTKETPSQILQGRMLRTRLDRLKPSREKQVAKAQLRQQRAAGGAHRALNAGDEVWCRVYQGLRRWVSGTVIEHLGTTDYQIRLGDGTEIHRHIDQLKLKGKSDQSQCTNNPIVGTGLTPQNTNRQSGNVLVFPNVPASEISAEVCSEDDVGGPGRLGANVDSQIKLTEPGLSKQSDNRSKTVASTTGESRPVRSKRPPQRYGLS